MKKGWFKIAGVQDGDRTLEMQLTGLELLLENVAGKTVLDLGCAEGLISKHVIDRGAAQVDGLSIVESEIDMARKLTVGLPAQFHVVDLRAWNKWLEANPRRLRPRYDVVLMLSVIHKMKIIAPFVELALTFADDWLALRANDVVVDPRSGNIPYQLDERVRREFDLKFKGPGPHGEQVSIWRRRK